MAELTVTSPFAGLALPSGGERLAVRELPLQSIASIAPYPGMLEAVAERLGGFPSPGELLTLSSGRCAWAGRETAFLWGTPPDLAGLAAVTDQSDGWAGLSLAGPDVGEVLARLVPVDLAALSPPASIRTLLNHLPLLLLLPEREVFELWSFRSMAGSLVHELSGAIRSVAARRAQLE